MSVPLSEQTLADVFFPPEDARPADQTLIRAVVTQRTPLRVKPDGNDNEMPYTPDNYVGALYVGDTVLLGLLDGRLVVLSRLGGMYPKALTAGEDLDTLVQLHTLVQGTDANATVALHYPPVGLAGILEVIPYSGGTRCLQRYTTFVYGQVWNRWLGPSGWGTWKPASTITDIYENTTGGWSAQANSYTSKTLTKVYNGGLQGGASGDCWVCPADGLYQIEGFVVAGGAAGDSAIQAMLYKNTTAHAFTDTTTAPVGTVLNSPQVTTYGAISSYAYASTTVPLVTGDHIILIARVLSVARTLSILRMNIARIN